MARQRRGDRAAAHNTAAFLSTRTEDAANRGFRAPGGIAAPVLSVVFCVLLMSGLPILTWLRFFAWLAIGLTIYFLYSRHRSEFAKK